MSGDTNKAYEVFYLLTLRGKFKQEMQSIRKRHKKSSDSEIYKDLAPVLNKYELPTTSGFVSLALDYIKKNKLPSVSEIKKLDDNALFHLDVPAFPIRKRNIRYVQLMIFDGAKKTDAKKFIVDNWKKIEILLKAQRRSTTDDKRVRRTTYKDENEYIYYLSQKTREHLGLVGSRGRKDDIIVEMVKKKYDRTITRDHVRTIIKEQKKLHSM